MKRFAVIFSILIAAFCLYDCSDSSNNVWDEMPLQISEFISRYYPGSAVSKFVEQDSQYYVEIKDGPQIIFNSSSQWTTVDGRGEVLPAIFLFDDLPPALYSYLQENEAVHQVYAVTRADDVYTLKLLNSSVSYSTTQGIIS